MKVYQKGVFKHLQDFHLTHHINPTKNFGQTTPIWDYLFGTMTANQDTRENNSMKLFVKDQQC